MGWYTLVNPASLVAGQPEDISQVVANLQAIQTILNGGIDNTNVNAAAALAPSKFAGYPADPTKFLRGDSVWALAGGSGGYTSGAVVSGANTDLALPSPMSAVNVINIGTGGGSIRSVGAPQAPGAVLWINNWTGSTSVTILHMTAGGTGARLYITNPSATNYILQPVSAAYSIGFYYDGVEWVQFSGPTAPNVTIGATPPTNPNAGDEWIYDVSSGTGVYWTFVFDPSQATYKWRYVGGPPLVSTVLASDSNSGASYGDLANVGPSIVLARAGDYSLSFRADGNMQTAAGAYRIAPAIGATAATDADSASGNAFTNATNVNGTAAQLNLLKTGIPASTTVKLQYRKDGGSASNVFNRVLSIIPVRVI